MTWALKSLKDFYFNGLHLRKVYIAWTKKSREELSFMTLKTDAKFEEKLTCCLENDRKNFEYFHQSTQKVSKLELWWDPFAQRSYVSWKWRMIQKLKNWLVILKLTRENSQIVTWALKILKTLCFSWLLETKVYMVWATKVQRSYLLLKRYANFEEKLVVWKKTWEIWQIFSRALESVKIGTLMGSISPK